MDQQVLDLKDIHLPAPISWWPIATGWWLLLACMVLLIIIIYFSRKYYKSKQLNREINAEFALIKKRYWRTKNKSELARSLSVLLRRTSISLYSEKEVAGLTGENWLAFLDNTSKKQKNANSRATQKFQSDTGNALVVLPYLPENNNYDFDAQALISLCETWLKTPGAQTPETQRSLTII